MSFFWHLHTHHAASQASAAANRAGREARSAKSGIDDVETRLDRALMACEAMWTIMRDKLDLTDTQLLDRINEIDLSDGKLDGKVRKVAFACPSCGRTIARRMSKCMYCNQVVMKDPFT